MAETVVRMGELAASASAEDVLVTLGLGSCIGVALIDSRRGVAGLAHVMLPEASGTQALPGKFADTAVPALLAEVLRLGAVKAMLDAVIVGGAQMFGTVGKGLDVGVRNEAAVRGALDALRIPLRAAETKGSKGRTVRVHVDSGSVTVRVAGQPEQQLWGRGVVKAAA